MHSTVLEGAFLVAMPRMGDERFENTVVFLCAHSDEGSMGFVVNRPMQELSMEEFFLKLDITTEAEREALGSQLQGRIPHTGGPVEPGRGFVLHTPDYTGTGTLRINDEVCLTATLEILRAIAVGEGPERFMLALGYSGWSPGQLEEEIAANGWLVGKFNSEIIFDRDDDTKYNRAMFSMGIDPALLSADTGHA